MHRTTRAACLVVALAAACSGGDDVVTPPTVHSDAAAVTAPAPAPVTSPPTTESTPPATTQPLDQSLGPVAAPIRNSVAARSIYFVMPDRFENGDPANDTGGLDGGPLDHGFLPEHRGYHHGGDLAGLIARLPYLAELGVGAIWITPPFTNRYVQGDGTIDGSSSSYHGYWQIDWDRVDPHLGSEAEMQEFIAASHALGIAVIFDVVVNHTGDIIGYAEGEYSYIGTRRSPYRDADGNEFDAAALAGSDEFPELDPETSFPYTPIFRDPADAAAKSPDWLNDVTLYHNRGNSAFSGESDTLGDFFGLDDLFTEHPRVVDGMIELATDVIARYDIDGFRVDTMKHVNAEFWAEYAPAIRAAAAERGKPDFFLFGEVFEDDPILLSAFTSLGVSSTLDFVVNAALRQYVAGNGRSELLAQAFDSDDWFTDADGNASMQVTFFGNHDQGRMGNAIASLNPSADDAELVARARLANDLLFLTRGAPVVYYGDEQGFTGDGGDQLARQDMFPSVTPEYIDDDNLGSDATPADDNFDATHPLYRHIAELNELRAEHPTFVDGAQYVHPGQGPVFAYSRIDRAERVEYVVLTNSDVVEATGVVRVLTPDTSFVELDGTLRVASDSEGMLTVAIPPLATVVLQADTPNSPPDEPPTISLVRPDDGKVIRTPIYRFEAGLSDRRYAEVTFAISVDGGEHQVIGVDDAPPYRVYWRNGQFAAGSEIEVVATVDDGSGRLRSDVVTVSLADRAQ